MHPAPRTPHPAPCTLYRAEHIHLTSLLSLLSRSSTCFLTELHNTRYVLVFQVANPDTEPQKAAAREALALKDFLAGVYAGGATDPVTGEAILPTISGPAHDLGQFPLPCRA